MIYSPFVLLVAVVVGFMVMSGEAIQPNEFTRYTTITGFFEQDDPATSPSGFDYVSENAFHV